MGSFNPQVFISIYKVPSTVLGTAGVMGKMQFLLSWGFLV